MIETWNEANMDVIDNSLLWLVYFAYGGHINSTIGTKYVNFAQDLSYIIPTK
jgi:hypothetical protein